MWARAAVAFGLAVGGGAAAAQDYPSRPITMLVAFPAGGYADAFARVVADRLSDKLHQSVVVENRGGASGNIGAASVAHANPDGYTLLVTTASIAVNETYYKAKNYVASDLRAIAIPAGAPETLSVNPNDPAKTLGELIASAREKPFDYASPGVGTSSHVVAAYFFKELAQIAPVPGRSARGQRRDGRARPRAGRDLAGLRGPAAIACGPRPGRLERQAGAGVFRYSDLRRGRLSPGRHQLGRRVRAGQGRRCDRRQAERGDQRDRGRARDRGEAADLQHADERAQPRRHRELLPRRSRQMGQDGRDDRDRGEVTPSRHCERSEAISLHLRTRKRRRLAWSAFGLRANDR